MKTEQIDIDRNSRAYEAQAEYRGLTGMPGRERARIEKSSKQTVAVRPDEPAATPLTVDHRYR
jgi:hypothetical protein